MKTYIESFKSLKQNLTFTRVISMFVIVLFFTGPAIIKQVELYRGASNYGWVFSYGIIIGTSMIFSSLLLSVSNIIIILTLAKYSKIEKTVWITISAVPIYILLIKFLLIL